MEAEKAVPGGRIIGVNIPEEFRAGKEQYQGNEQGKAQNARARKEYAPQTPHSQALWHTF
jgi:hypothetical protein